MRDERITVCRSLKKADYSKAKGLTKEGILKHETFESIVDGRYLVKVEPGYVQSDKGPFILDLGAIPAVSEIGPASALRDWCNDSFSKPSSSPHAF